MTPSSDEICLGILSDDDLAEFNFESALLGGVAQPESQPDDQQLVYESLTKPISQPEECFSFKRKCKRRRHSDDDDSSDEDEAEENDQRLITSFRLDQKADTCYLYSHSGKRQGSKACAETSSSLKRHKRMNTNHQLTDSNNKKIKLF